MGTLGFSDMSYCKYKEIIRDILETGKYCDYTDVISENRLKFIVMRHDIEFSPERAIQMQKIENSLDFKSSYFFQITNNTYNALSKKNMDVIREINSNGHHIGLHYHLNGKTDLHEITEEIERQSGIMSEMLGIEVGRFSFHRPTKEVLGANIKVGGLINTYNPLFFSFVEKIAENTKLDVKYISDSMHRWNYGTPDAITLSEFNKIQILIHPYSWTHIGHNNLDNFRALIEEKNSELLLSIDSECKHFRDVRDAL